MNAPYREPGTAPSEEVVLNHDYIADVRRDRDPKRTLKRIAVGSCAAVSVGLGLIFLHGGSVFDLLGMVAGVAAYLGVIFFPLVRMLMRHADRNINVADLLDDTDERGRKDALKSRRGRRRGIPRTAR